MMPRVGKRFLSSLTAVGINPFGLKASLPSGVFKAESMTGNNAMTGMPNATHSCATEKSKSKDTRFTPGIEATACD